MKKLRVAIIGSGFGQYGLLPAFRSIPECEVVALCGKKRQQLVDYCTATHFDFQKIYADWRTLLKKEHPDALALAVTPRGQYQIASHAIKQGIHIFAEKPLAINLSQAKKLLSLATRYRVVHGIDFIFPEIPEWEEAKKIIHERTYGSLRHISTEWDFLSYDIRNRASTWKTDAKEGGGALSFFFSHGLYYLENFAGKITKTKSICTYSPESINGAETGVDIVFTSKTGVTGAAHISCNTRGITRHKVTLYCEHATITLENRDSVVDNFTLEIHTEDSVKRIQPRTRRSRHGEDPRVKTVEKIAGRFVRACLHKTSMTPSFKNGVSVQTIIDTVRKESKKM